MTFSVFGLGKLGVPLSAVLAFKGHNVIAVDVNEDNVNAINSGYSPVEEPTEGPEGWWENNWTSEEAAKAAWDLWSTSEEAKAWSAFKNQEPAGRYQTTPDGAAPRRPLCPRSMS